MPAARGAASVGADEPRRFPKRRTNLGYTLLAAQHVGFVPVVQRIVFFTHQADGDDGAIPQIVLDSNGAMGRFEVLPHNGKARPDAPNIVFIGSTAEENLAFGLFFRGDAGAMIGEADGVPFVENGDHHL